MLHGCVDNNGFALKLRKYGEAQSCLDKLLLLQVARDNL